MVREMASQRGSLQEQNIQTPSRKVALALPVAPHAWQKRFAEQAAAARSIADQQVAAMAKAQAIFDALLARAFA